MNEINYDTINYEDYPLLTDEMNHEEIWENYVKNNNRAICGNGHDTIQEVIKSNTALYKQVGVEAYLQPWGNIVDVGAGYNILQSFLSIHNTYYPCDLIERMPNTIKVNQDCILPFQDNFADGIVSINTFQHLTPHQRFTYINEFERVLVPNGKAIVTFTSDVVFNPPHPFCYTGQYRIPIVDSKEFSSWNKNLLKLDIKQRYDGLTTIVLMKPKND